MTQDKELIYEFDQEAKLEILVNTVWIEVSPWIFRSWSGGRKVDGKAYSGTVFSLGMNTIVRKEGE